MKSCCPVSSMCQETWSTGPGSSRSGCSIGSGPTGFRCEVLEQGAASVGTTWRFNMIAPGGQIFSNRIRFLEIIPGERLVYDHGSDLNDDPNRFHVTITFDEQADGKTVLTLRQFHPSKDRRDATIGSGAVELGYQTLGKLVEYLARG